MSEPQDSQNLTSFSREERIKQLTEIDKNVAKLLRSAGEAIQALTGEKLLGAEHKSSESERKSAFTTVTSQYFSLLSSVDVNIRRQIYALEEANIITSDPGQKESRSDAKSKAVSEAGNLGNLDVGWLNSRNDKVGKEMEAELWEKAHSLLKQGKATND